MKLPYGEGDWFAVPLRSGGYAVGVVARMAKHGKVLLGYFFGPQRDHLPTLDEVTSLDPARAVRVLRFGDLALLNGEWPIIGRCFEWDRRRWRMPAFVRRNELRRSAWKVEYADDDPNEVAAESPLTSGGDDIELDALLGAGAVELVLTKLLTTRG